MVFVHISLCAFYNQVAMDISVLKHASADLHPTPQQSQNAGLGQGKEKSPRGVILQKMLGSRWRKNPCPQASKICYESGGVQVPVPSPSSKAGQAGQQVASESTSPVLQKNAGQQGDSCVAINENINAEAERAVGGATKDTVIKHTD